MDLITTRLLASEMVIRETLVLPTASFGEYATGMTIILV